MTVFAGLAALAMATSVGYYVGRRAGSTPPTWKKRTIRMTLGRQVIGLLVLLTVRRIQQNLRVQPMFADTVYLRRMRLVAPVEFLRGGVARMRT